MDDRKIRALLTTLRTGSFSKAAIELNCTQSAVTQMMNALENELECKILNRSHTGVRLTPAGEELYPLLVEAEAALSRLASEARNLSDGGHAIIRIGSFASISSTWLPQAIRAYQAQNPKASFDLRIGTDNLPEWLAENRIDLALGDAYRCQGLRWYPLLDDPYYAVVPADLLPPEQKVISQEDFSRYPLIMAPMNALAHHLDVLSHQQLTVSSDDDSSILAMVATWWIVSYFLVTDENGNTPTVTLPAYPEKDSLSSETAREVEYSADVYAEGFQEKKNLPVSASGGAEIVLNVELTPNEERTE